MHSISFQILLPMPNVSSGSADRDKRPQRKLFLNNKNVSPNNHKRYTMCAYTIIIQIAHNLKIDCRHSATWINAAAIHSPGCFRFYLI